MPTYLAGFEDGTARIITQPKSPLMTRVDGKYCSSCSTGDDEADLREGSKIPVEPCRMCGSPFSTNYGGNERMLKKHICFHCNFWDEYVEKKDDPHIARVGGKHYWINASSSGDTQFNGFGGSKFHVKWNDGREAVSNDVWHQGDIPERFRAQLPNNAEFLHDRQDA